jgi:hypothetical protein
MAPPNLILFAIIKELLEVEALPYLEGLVLPFQEALVAFLARELVEVLFLHLAVMVEEDWHQAPFSEVEEEEAVAL